MLTVVLTLRGDFFGRVLAHRALADRLQDGIVNLGPMTREELEHAIRQFLKDKATLVILDEIDHPMPKERESIIYQLLQLPKTYSNHQVALKLPSKRITR